MTNKVTYASIAVFVCVWFIAFVIFFNGWTVPWVTANPDYICKKQVTDQPCEIRDCQEWSQDWERVCAGTRVTEVSYYLIRTQCEDGYTRVSAWWNVWGSSGRQGADYTSNAEVCFITQYDNVVPEGIIGE